jgi:hypothetical protein
MEELHLDRRRFHCCRCKKVVYICSHCDRGQMYCSERCRDEARRACVREAGARYQQTRRGREKHARRQQRYRDRQSDGEEVTHHPCRTEAVPSTLVTCGTPNMPKATQHSSTAQSRCDFCGHGCEPYVRLDFLRCRRPVRRRRREFADDSAGGEGRDPTPA